MPVVAALALTAGFVHTTAAYWAYWDMGINPAANRSVLLILYAPAVFALLLAAGCAAAVTTRRTTGRHAFIAAVGAQALLAVAAFAGEVVRTAPARSDSATVADFLRSQATRIAAGELEPLRRRP